MYNIIIDYLLLVYLPTELDATPSSCWSSTKYKAKRVHTIHYNSIGCEKMKKKKDKKDDWTMGASIPLPHAC